MRDLPRKIVESPVLITIFVLIFSTISVMVLSYNLYDREFWENILIEAHGMLFDIAIIGIIIFLLTQSVENRRERKREIQRYKDEIDDFRGRESEESVRRITGCIKRLNKLGVSTINLSNSYLVKMYLEEANLKGAQLLFANLTTAYLRKTNLVGAALFGANLAEADLWSANLAETDLRDINLKGASLRDTNLTGANLSGGDLQKANLTKADLREANLQEANLSGADLREANLTRANLLYANLQEADLTGVKLLEADLDKAKLIGTNLKEVEDLTTDQLANVNTLFKAILPPDLENEMKEKYAHLFDAPFLE